LARSAPAVRERQVVEQQQFSGLQVDLDLSVIDA
jgi:hypothetical protein